MRPTYLFLLLSLGLYLLPAQDTSTSLQRMAVLSIDSRGLRHDDQTLGSMVRLELQKMGGYEVIDRYDMMREGGFYSKVPKTGEQALAMTVTASDPGDNVSYFAHGVPSSRGVVKLHGKLKADRWLKRHCTHFVRVIVPRIGADKIFKLKRA